MTTTGGIRFAADLVAGHIHNPHAPECACPCDKPDPALLPTHAEPEKEEVQDLARIMRDTGSSPQNALALARLILRSGYRRAPSEMPPAEASAGRRSGSREGFELPGYLHPDGDGWLLMAPCRRCNTWHPFHAENVIAGDRVTSQTACPMVTDTVGRIMQPEVTVMRMVVQAVRFNQRAWVRGGRVAKTYWSLHRG